MKKNIIKIFPLASGFSEESIQEDFNKAIKEVKEENNAKSVKINNISIYEGMFQYFPHIIIDVEITNEPMKANYVVKWCDFELVNKNILESKENFLKGLEETNKKKYGCIGSFIFNLYLGNYASKFENKKIAFVYEEL